MTSSVDVLSSVRLKGRWEDALRELEGRDDADALVERVLVLADESLLARDRSAELADAIAAVERVAGDDRRLEAFVLARRGLALHSEFLHDRSGGEPDGELDYFERALALRREIGDERGVAESLFHVGLVHHVVRGEHATARPFFRSRTSAPSRLATKCSPRMPCATSRSATRRTAT
jgi:hypothetical protein